MLGGEVLALVLEGGGVGALLAGGFFEAVGDLVEGGGDGGGEELVFVFEVSVEATVGEAGGVHDVGDGGGFEAAFAEETGGVVEDAGVVFLHFFAGDSHGGSWERDGRVQEKVGRVQGNGLGAGGF